MDNFLIDNVETPNKLKLSNYPSLLQCHLVKQCYFNCPALQGVGHE